MRHPEDPWYEEHPEGKYMNTAETRKKLISFIGTEMAEQMGLYGVNLMVELLETEREYVSCRCVEIAEEERKTQQAAAKLDGCAAAHFIKAKISAEFRLNQTSDSSVPKHTQIRSESSAA